MRIAYFTDTYRPTINGISTSVANYAERLRERGHEVTIFAPNAPDFEELGMFPVRSIPLPVQPNFRLGLPLSISLNAAVDADKFDLVHVHTPGLVGMTGLTLAARHGLPRIYTYHTMISDYARHYLPAALIGIHTAVDKLDSFFCNRFQHILAPTDFVADYIREAKIQPPVEVLPTGIDVRSFAAPDHQIPPDQPLTIGCVCRLAIEKNLEFLLEAFALLHRHRPDIVLELAGTGQARYVAELKQLCQTLQITDAVRFVGPISRAELPAYLANLDVFAYACNTDTQGLVIMEAMAAGKPIVTLDHLVFRHVIEHRVSGLLSPANTQTFADLLVELVDDPELRSAIGRAARTQALDFDLERLTDRLETIYQSLLPLTIEPLPDV